MAARDLFGIRTYTLVSGSWRPERQFPKNPGPPRRAVAPDGAIRPIRSIRIIRSNLRFFLPVARQRSKPEAPGRSAQSRSPVVFSLVFSEDVYRSESEQEVGHECSRSRVVLGHPLPEEKRAEINRRNDGAEKGDRRIMAKNEQGASNST